jgi:transposase-like protein
MAVRRSKAFWTRHVTALEQSGLSMVDYCRWHGLDYGTLADWRRRLGVDQKRRPTPVPSLVPIMVETTAPTMLIEIRVGTQVTVSVPSSVDPSWLGELLRAVSSC